MSGCENHCKGCQNPQTWDSSSGRPFTIETMQKLLDEVRKEKCDGLSLSGGDPLFPGNVSTVKCICRIVKLACPDKPIWMWTGYRMEYLTDAQKAALDDVDVLIDRSLY